MEIKRNTCDAVDARHTCLTRDPRKNRKTKKWKIRVACCAVLPLAALCGRAHADDGSSVQVYGLVGTYVDSLKRSDMSAHQVQEGSGGLVTSFWGLRGKENLGGGTSAIFSLESFFQPNNGGQGRSSSDPFWSRNAYVGLSNNRYGKLTLGRQTNPTYVTMQMVNPFGSSVVFSPLVLQSFVASYGGAIIGDTVWNNVIEYATPTYKGLTGTAVYGVGGVAGKPGVADLGLHVTYVGSALTAVFSAQRVRTVAVAPTSAQYAYLAGAAYDFKVVRLYAAAEMTSNIGPETGTHTYELGASVPLSPTNFILAEWARTRRSGGKTNNQLRNTGALALDHFFSRHTDVYLVYSADKLSGHGLGNTYGAGIRTLF